MENLAASWEIGIIKIKMPQKGILNSFIIRYVTVRNLDTVEELI